MSSIVDNPRRQDPSLRVLVTGAAGFIGGHLCWALAERGLHVLALVRPGSDWSRLQGVPNLRIVYGSVRSREWIGQVEGADCAVHLAADWARLNPADDLAFARRMGGAGVRRLVFVSSICAAGLDHCPHPIPEDGPAHFDPGDFYGRYKRDTEQGLGRLAAELGLQLAILRPTIVYGPGDAGNLVPLAEAIAQNRLALWAHGQTLLRLCSVDNLVRVVVEAVLSGRVDGLTLNVADDECLHLREVCHRLAEALGVPFHYRNHGLFLARQRAWLRFVANRFQLADSFGTHFAFDKWTRAFDADIAALRTVLPEVPVGPFDARLAVGSRPLPAPRPGVSLPLRLVRAMGILGEMVRFRIRRWVARRRSAC